MNFLLTGVSLAAAVVSLGSLGSGGLACSSMGPLRVTTSVKIPGSSLELAIESGPPPRSQQTMKVDNRGGKPVSGCTSFKDAEGNVVGQVPMTLPSGQRACLEVPENATTYCLELKDQVVVEDASDGKGNRRSGAGTPTNALHGRWGFQQDVFLPRVDGQPNVSCSMYVDALRAEDARAIAAEVINGGPQASIPTFGGTARLEVIHYSEASFNLFTGAVTILVANDETYESLEIYVNGVYATSLKEGMIVPSSNGWDARRFVLPASVFEYDPTIGASWTNEYEIVFRTTGANTDTTIDGSFQYVSDI